MERKMQMKIMFFVLLAACIILLLVAVVLGYLLVIAVRATRELETYVRVLERMTDGIGKTNNTYQREQP